MSHDLSGTTPPSSPLANAPTPGFVYSLHPADAAARAAWEAAGGWVPPLRMKDAIACTPMLPSAREAIGRGISQHAIEVDAQFELGREYGDWSGYRRAQAESARDLRKAA